ncbi:MAG: ribose-phosphate diphosphokinase [Bacteriovoracia bacterium]
MRKRDWIVLSGNSNPGLAQAVCQTLDKPLAKAEVKRFSDGEVFIEIGENVRGRDAYIIQSTCPPTNDNLMELLIMIDALKRASAKEITAILPYFGYARQDRKVAPRTPITARLVADLIAKAGATRVVAVDLHAGQIQGFFDIPSDNLFAMPVLLDYIKNELTKHAPLVMVSPDAGGVERARAYAKRIDATVAMIDKRRLRANEAKAMNVVGDVKDMTAVLIDDMIDTAGTLTEAAHAVMKNGAKAVYAVATHGVLSGPAVKRIQESIIQQVIVTDTIPLSPEAAACGKIKQISMAKVLAQAIERIRNYDSLSNLFV